MALLAFSNQSWLDPAKTQVIGLKLPLTFGKLNSRPSETLIPTTCPRSPFFTSSSIFCHLTKAPNCNSYKIKDSAQKFQVFLEKATSSLPESLMSP